MYERVGCSSPTCKGICGEGCEGSNCVAGGKFWHGSPYHPQTITHVEVYSRKLAIHLSLMLYREDQGDKDWYLREAEKVQVGSPATGT